MRDEIYMARALKLAYLGRFTTHPNPNVGCVIVKNDVIVGEGYHSRAGDPHAEVYALRMAGGKSKEATVYVTLEPCSHYGRTPPCCEALIAAGVKRVVVAMQDPNPEVSGRGMYLLQKKGIAVTHGVMAKEAELLNKGFLKRIRTGFPYLSLKFGASLDGKIAMTNGESFWITSNESRRDVQRIRAQSHAILTSHATILSDNPALTVRWNELDEEIKRYYPEKKLRQPLRIIIDSQNKLVPKKKIFQQPGEIWLVRLHEDNRQWPKNLRSIIVPEYNDHTNLVKLMVLLGKEQINSILVEAGSTLSGALIQAGLIDELIIYLAPKLLGNNARSLCTLPGLEVLANAPNFLFSTIRPVGPDLCMHLVTTSGISTNTQQ